MYVLLDSVFILFTGREILYPRVRWNVCGLKTQYLTTIFEDLSCKISFLLVSRYGLLNLQYQHLSAVPFFSAHDDFNSAKGYITNTSILESDKVLKYVQNLSNLTPYLITYYSLNSASRLFSLNYAVKICVFEPWDKPWLKQNLKW